MRDSSRWVKWNHELTFIPASNTSALTSIHAKMQFLWNILWKSHKADSNLLFQISNFKRNSIQEWVSKPLTTRQSLSLWIEIGYVHFIHPSDDVTNSLMINWSLSLLYSFAILMRSLKLAAIWMQGCYLITVHYIFFKTIDLILQMIIPYLKEWWMHCMSLFCCLFKTFYLL